MQTTDPQDELFDVVNEEDVVVGTATRKQVHSDKSLIHRVVHIWITNSKNQILLQKRSLTKDSYPGAWDISCAGHIMSGDDPETTAERELLEELGIKADCHYISKNLARQPHQSEIVYLFHAYSEGPFVYPKNEISQVRFYSVEEIFRLLESSDFDAGYFSEKEIPIIFEYLKKT